MANFVLVHGAWHGGWCYRDTAQALRAAGHSVFTPTHTGVGERFHQSAENITLETHVRDVVGCIEWEELNDVVLVGHSYGGMVISGVADRMAERIRALVFLDAFVPENGESLMDLLNKALAPEVAVQFTTTFLGAAAEGYCGLTQPIPAEMFNVVEAKRAWVNRRCRPQALATFESPALLSGKHLKVPQRLYILADGWDPSPFRYFAAQAEGRAGWRVVKVPCGHDVMVDMPKELAAELLKLV